MITAFFAVERRQKERIYLKITWVVQGLTCPTWCMAITGTDIILLLLQRTTICHLR